jgi:hypothetical protein
VSMLLSKQIMITMSNNKLNQNLKAYEKVYDDGNVHGSQRYRICR